MHDGEIVADEPSTIGEIPDAARRSMYFMPRKTEEDDLAGVSALMQAIAHREEVPALPRKKIKARPRTYKARGKKSRLRR
jgi:hypothetical protein